MKTECIRREVEKAVTVPTLAYFQNEGIIPVKMMMDIFMHSQSVNDGIRAMLYSQLYYDIELTPIV
jgi:hypothetical protein